ncbi:uncharacterized protein LOC120359110 [Solenopsis invicta]|uniref:uncharacterized protein LOC120359110 n=1 Tax=Solenopsis invicta TaxID=13686 RepID=UPI00193E3780|nr:uncharacterized protein LOC120359110 [Solenopsis invicta]
MTRSVIAQYAHKDVFHVDELTMYSDISPTYGISESTARQDEQSDTSLKKMTVLLCCNVSGTEKLPLLICGSYLAGIMGKDHMYSHSEDASINDGLFGEWLTQLNHRMMSNDRRILLLLHGNRIGAFRDLELSNIRHVFFPDDLSISPLLRPLERDVFHFVKMAYRNKYVEGIRGRRRWNVDNVMRSLVEAWQEVTRDLIIASFQRTGFRIDDCFSKMRCDTWENLETGISFRKFVTFDDHFMTDVSHRERESTGRSHSNNPRTRETVRFNDWFNSTTTSEESDPIVAPARANGNLNEIRVEKDVDWKRKNPLKRSHDKAQLDRDLYEGAEPGDESTSKRNEVIAVVPASPRPPKVIDVQTIESIAGSSKSDSVHSTTRASVNESGTDTEYDCKTDKTARNEESRKNSRVLSNEPSIGSPDVDDANGGDIALQQVFDNTSAVYSNTKEPGTKVVSCDSPRGEIEPANLADGKVECFSRKSLKRRCVNAEATWNSSNDDEPERKRLRSDSDWTKQYEATFVFGSFDLARTVTTVSANALSDNGVPQPRPRRSCEKNRSIFTICPRRNWRQL